MIKIFSRLIKLLFRIAPPVGVRVAFQLFCWPMGGKIRNREERIRSKARKTHSFLNGKLIRQLEWGDGDKTALLVHGWGSNGGGLGGFVKPLNSAGYKVVAFDGPAHGESEGHTANILEFSGVIADLLQKLDSVDTVISHSFGSAATVMALGEHPKIRVPNFVMFTTPDELEELAQEFSRLMKLSTLHHRMLVGYIAKRLDRPVEEVSVHKMGRRVNADRVMLLHGKRDSVLPFEGAKRVAEQWQGLEFVALEKTGHYRMLWDPEIIERVISFVEIDTIRYAGSGR